MEAGTVADVFPDFPPGQGTTPEIVAVFASYLSARVIRIYDLEGGLRCKFWHDGSISSVYWMPPARLLICAGDNAEDDDKPLPPGHGLYWKPRVIFAVRPQLEGFDNAWPGIESAERLGRLCRPVWYRWIYPTNLPPEFSLHLNVPSPPHDPNRSVQLEVAFRPLAAGIGWVVDENGESLRGTRLPSTNWTVHQADLPDPNEFGLGPLRGGTEADISRP